ncbi:MAG: AAA family ATPase [Oleispira sp.]|nr:AAA family ATPase [Oleispira sp.]MBL4881531.1 AAA family ATPase [Oleispira sp.]
MTKIVELNIKNYRGIRNLSLQFDRDESLICLIGRGDSGKSTILSAISSVLSPKWNSTFTDTDFYNCNIADEIEIVASVVDFPEALLSDRKYGLMIRGFHTYDKTITDDVSVEDQGDHLVPLLSIKLTINKSLEPLWTVFNGREQEDITITASDRAKLNCYLISDYVDSHFSWNKGGPLYSLLKSEGPDADADTGEGNIVLEHLRNAKNEIDKNTFDNLDAVTALITTQAAELGLDILKASTTLDSKELIIKDAKVSLHEGSVPFRLKGKGSKRLASIAIQSVLVRHGGIMLIDELEQGLEPDRIKQAVRSLGDHSAGQIFMTTHSRDAITELGAQPLLFLLKNKYTDEIETRSLNLSNEDLQKAVRACPEAFFSKKVIICEGATEVGICMAIDTWRKSKSMPLFSFRDCSFIDGTGNTIVQRVDEINGVGLDTALFCDSDLEVINNKKESWKRDGVAIFDCDNGLCLEQQVFKDMPWEGVQELLQYARDKNRESFLSAFPDVKNTKISEWKDSIELRQQIISIFKPKKKTDSCGKGWFKAIHHGVFIGQTIFKHYEKLEQKSGLKVAIKGLNDWVDEVWK